jgi:hypothetical protein
MRRDTYLQGIQEVMVAANSDSSLLDHCILFGTDSTPYHSKLKASLAVQKSIPAWLSTA